MSRVVPLLPLWDFLACYKVNFTENFGKFGHLSNKEYVAWRFFILWDMTVCNLAQGFQIFLKTFGSEYVQVGNQTIQCHIQEQVRLYSYRRENVNFVK
jgi:hypothetical protein